MTVVEQVRGMSDFEICEYILKHPRPVINKLMPHFKAWDVCNSHMKYERRLPGGIKNTLQSMIVAIKANGIDNT